MCVELTSTSKLFCLETALSLRKEPLLHEFSWLLSWRVICRTFVARRLQNHIKIRGRALKAALRAQVLMMQNQKDVTQELEAQLCKCKLAADSSIHEGWDECFAQRPAAGSFCLYSTSRHHQHVLVLQALAHSTRFVLQGAKASNRLTVVAAQKQHL